MFGQNVDFGSLQYEITNVKLINNLSTININDMNEDTNIELEWVGLKDSELIITKASESKHNRLKK